MANYKRKKFKSKSMQCPICGSQRRQGLSQHPSGKKIKALNKIVADEIRV